jgi:hypothetical protein
VQGHNIQATIPLPLITLFQDLVVEGNVYEMHLFFVALNVQEAMSTYHTQRLFFLMRTMVIPADCIAIPMYGFSLIDSEAVLEHFNGYSYLVG